jgi:hypothetical protein
LDSISSAAAAKAACIAKAVRQARSAVSSCALGNGEHGHDAVASEAAQGATVFANGPVCFS